MSLAPSPSVPLFPYGIDNTIGFIVVLVAFMVAVLLALCHECCARTSSMNHSAPAPDIGLGLPRNPTPHDALARYIELVLPRNSTLHIDAFASDIELGLPRYATPVQTQEEQKRNNVEIVYKCQESDGDDTVTKDCSICLEEFNDGEYCMVLSCNHTYHRDCINLWLRQSRHCPLCRYSVSRGEELSLKGDDS